LLDCLWEDWWKDWWEDWWKDWRERVSRECLQDKLDKVATGASEKRSPISRTRVNMAIRRRGTLRYYADIRESAVI